MPAENLVPKEGIEQLMNGTLESSEPVRVVTEPSELDRVSKRLERERQARLQAESITEKVTRELYEKQRELMLLQTVAVAANEASSVEEAMQTALDRVCEHTGWPVGHVYFSSDQSKGTLSASRIWHLQQPERFEIFRKVTEAMPLMSGVGLPGRVLANRQPVWVPDVTQDSNFPRAKQAVDIGVRGAFAFPVFVGREVAAVMEFFTPHAAEPNEPLLKIMANIGTQIGRVIERKRAEQEQKIFSAKLASNNRELQDFAYVASHDLQEPLRKVQAFGERLKSKCTDALTTEGRDYLDRMQNAAARMQVLINDLLALSRITTKAQPFAAVDLNKIAREVLSDLEIRIEQTGGKVELGDLATIEADPLQMRQLLQNLIGNALKFHRKDAKPIIKLATQLSQNHELLVDLDAQADVCVLTVADNGIGFDEKYTERIFGAFQRLHGRNEYEGTGVGLAICRKIAQRHGGTIVAKSTPGQGATFIVTLPLKQAKGSNPS